MIDLTKDYRIPYKASVFLDNFVLFKLHIRFRGVTFRVNEYTGCKIFLHTPDSVIQLFVIKNTHNSIYVTYGTDIRKVNVKEIHIVTR